MRIHAILLATALAVTRLSGQSDDIHRRYQPVADRIIAAATADSAAWNRLAEMADRFGHRFSGSENLERALDWILVEMAKDGLAEVRGEPVMVPRWVRGGVRRVGGPARWPLVMLTGGSIGRARGSRRRCWWCRASPSSSDGRARRGARSCCSTCRGRAGTAPRCAIARSAPSPRRARARWRRCCGR
jgi:hypothetical protein